MGLELWQFALESPLLSIAPYCPFRVLYGGIILAIKYLIETQKTIVSLMHVLENESPYLKITKAILDKMYYTLAKVAIILSDSNRTLQRTNLDAMKLTF